MPVEMVSKNVSGKDNNVSGERELLSRDLSTAAISGVKLLGPQKLALSAAI
jgi:hypothetical protein